MTRGRSAFRSLCFLLRPLGIRILASSCPSRSRETQRGQRKGLLGKVSRVQHALSRPAGVTTLGATGPSLPCGEEGALRAKPWLVLGLIAGEERWHPSQMTALWEPAWVGEGALGCPRLLWAQNSHGERVVAVSCWIETSPQGKARLVLPMSLVTTLGPGGWHSGFAETGCSFTSVEVGTKNDGGSD